MFFHDGADLNLSPLRNFDNVKFVFKPEKLAFFIEGISEMNKTKDKNQEYFYLDNRLPKWRKLLIGR